MTITSKNFKNDVGNFISVILTNEARIEGVLGEIDKPNSRIVIYNARNYGSEGRGNKTSQISPVEHRIETMILRERQIKDLELIYLPHAEQHFPALSQQKSATQMNQKPLSYKDAVAKRN